MEKDDVPIIIFLTEKGRDTLPYNIILMVVKVLHKEIQKNRIKKKKRK